jgi:hypothetical protein
MEQPEKKLSERESLALITSMINQAKQSYNDTGLSAMMWGAVIAVCSLVQLAQLHFGFRLPFNIYLLTIIAVVPQVMISIREKKSRKATAYDDVYMNYVWLGFGIAMFLLIIMNRAVIHVWGPVAGEYDKAILKKSAFQFYEYMSSFYLLLYGLPTFITGTACRFRPMLLGGILCWVFCVVALFTNFKIDLLLVAAAAIAAWFIPGIIMQKEYKKAKKQIGASGV